MNLTHDAEHFNKGQAPGMKTRVFLNRITATIAIGTALLLMCQTASAEDEISDHERATVDTSYIDMRTGPGRGYPIFYAIEQDEIVELIKRRTDWVKVRTRRGKTGWAHVSQMEETFGADGKQLSFNHANKDEYLARRWEIGFNGGDLEGANALGATLGYRFTQNLTAELKLSQATGQFSDSKIGSIAVMHQPFPEWRVSPFFIMGTGIIDTSPDTTLVQTEDRSDTSLLVGAGAYIYMNRRFVLRLEYNNYQVLTSRDENEEVNEWKLGFNVFF